MKSLNLIAALTISGLAHASGAVDYTCAGFEPGKTPSEGQTHQSVSFTMTGANDGITIQILSKSMETVDPKNAFLTVDKTCKFTMVPDDKYPAYRISISGKCGTQVDNNFKGMCFFDI